MIARELPKLCPKCGCEEWRGPSYNISFDGNSYQFQENLQWCCDQCGYQTKTRCLDSKEPE